VLDSLCEDCAAHFEAVKRALTALSIPYEVTPRLVRGLDYYTRTVFEIHAANLGAQNAVGGGGRYDQLVKDFGGPDTPAIGFSIGMERLLLATGKESSPPAPKPDVCVVSLTPDAAMEAQALARALRGPLTALVDVNGRSSNAQMKWASKTGARWAVFVPKGPEGYAVRDMAKGLDETAQPTADALRRWLTERRDLVEAGR